MFEKCFNEYALWSLNYASIMIWNIWFGQVYSKDSSEDSFYGISKFCFKSIFGGYNFFLYNDCNVTQTKLKIEIPPNESPGFENKSANQFDTFTFLSVGIILGKKFIVL